jgi:hypothetical protein
MLTPRNSSPRRKGKRGGGGGAESSASSSKSPRRDSSSAATAATVTGSGVEMMIPTNSGKRTKKKSTSTSIGSDDATSCASLDVSNSSTMFYAALGMAPPSPKSSWPLKTSIGGASSSAFAKPTLTTTCCPLSVLTPPPIVQRARHSDRLPEKQARALREYESSNDSSDYGSSSRDNNNKGGGDTKNNKGNNNNNNNNDNNKAHPASPRRTKSRSLSPRRQLVRGKDGTEDDREAAAVPPNETRETPEKEKEASSPSSTSTFTSSSTSNSSSRPGRDPTQRQPPPPRRTLSSDGSECGRRPRKFKNKNATRNSTTNNNNNNNTNNNNLAALARSAKQIKRLSMTESSLVMGRHNIVDDDDEVSDDDDYYDPLLHVLQEKYQRQQKAMAADAAAAAAAARGGGGCGTIMAATTTRHSSVVQEILMTSSNITIQQKRQPQQTTMMMETIGGAAASTSLLPTKRTTADTATAAAAVATPATPPPSRRAGGLVASDSAIKLLAQFMHGDRQVAKGEEEKGDVKIGGVGTSLLGDSLHDLDRKEPLAAVRAAATGDCHTVGGGNGIVSRRPSPASASVNPKNNSTAASSTTGPVSPRRRPNGVLRPRQPPSNNAAIGNHLESLGAKNGSPRTRGSGAATVQGLTTRTTTTIAPPSSPRRKPSRPGDGKLSTQQQLQRRLRPPEQHQTPISISLPPSPRKNGSRPQTPPPPPPPPPGLPPVSSLDNATAAESDPSLSAVETAAPAAVGANARPRRQQPNSSGAKKIALEEKDDKLMVATGNKNCQHQQTSAPVSSIQQENPQSGTLHESPANTADQKRENEEASKQPVSSRMSPKRRTNSSRDIGKMIQQAGNNTVKLRSSAVTVQGVIGSRQSDAQERRNAYSDDPDSKTNTNEEKQADNNPLKSPSSTVKRPNLAASVAAAVGDYRAKRMSTGTDTVASDDMSCFSIEEFKAPTAAAGNSAIDVPPSPTGRAAKRPGAAAVKIASDMTVAPGAVSIDTDSSMLAERTDEPAKSLEARPQVVPEGPRPANLSEEAQEGSMFEIFQKLQKMKEENNAVTRSVEIDMDPKNSASLPAEAEPQQRPMTKSTRSLIKDNALADTPAPESPRLASLRLHNQTLSRSPRVSGATTRSSSKSPSRARLALRAEQSPRTMAPLNPPLSPSAPIDPVHTLRIETSLKTNMPRAVFDAHSPLPPTSPSNSMQRIAQLQEPSPSPLVPPRLGNREEPPQSHVNHATPPPPPAMGRSRSPQRVMPPPPPPPPGTPQRGRRRQLSPQRIPNSGSTQLAPSHSPIRIQEPASLQRNSRPGHGTMPVSPQRDALDSATQPHTPGVPSGVDQRKQARQAAPPPRQSETLSYQRAMRKQLSERRFSLQASPSKRPQSNTRRLSNQMDFKTPQKPQHQKPQQKAQPVDAYMCSVSPRRLNFEEGSSEQLQRSAEPRLGEMPQQTRPQGTTLSDKLDRARRAQTGRSSSSVSSAPVQRPRRQIHLRPQPLPQVQKTPRPLPNGRTTTATPSTMNSRPNPPDQSQQPRQPNRSPAKNPTRRTLQQKPQQAGSSPTALVSEQSPTPNTVSTIRLPHPNRGGTNSPNDSCRPSINDMKESAMENQSADMHKVTCPPPPPPSPHRSDRTGSNNRSTSLDENEVAAVDPTPENTAPPKLRRGSVGASLVGALLLGRVSKK